LKGDVQHALPLAQPKLLKGIQLYFTELDIQSEPLCQMLCWLYCYAAFHCAAAVSHEAGVALQAIASLYIHTRWHDGPCYLLRRNTSWVHLPASQWANTQAAIQHSDLASVQTSSA